MLSSKQDLAEHRELARGVKDDKINPYLVDAEELDVRPLLGDELYFDLLQNQTDEKYTNLLNKLDYKHCGLKKIICLFAYSRYILYGSFTDTSFGFVQKNHNDSQPVSNDFKRNISTRDKQSAIQYFQDIVKYLDDNKNVYPLWKKGCSAKVNKGLRISKIS